MVGAISGLANAQVSTHLGKTHTQVPKRTVIKGTKVAPGTWSTSVRLSLRDRKNNRRSLWLSASADDAEVKTQEAEKPTEPEKPAEPEKPKSVEPKTSAMSTLASLEKMGIVQEEEKKEQMTVQKTVSALDAMLGIEEEEENKVDEKSDAPQKTAAQLSEDERIDQVYANLKKITDEEDNGNFGPEQADKLQKEFETLVELMSPELMVPKEDVKVFLNKVFGFNTFWVTDNAPNIDPDGGWVFKGNLRAPRDEVFASVRAAMAGEFGDKYELRMVQEPLSLVEVEAGAEADRERVSFIVVPSAVTAPLPTTSWQLIVSLILAGFTVLTAVQLGLVAEITRLPAETVAWLSSPESQDLALSPPGLDDFDPVAYFDSAMPIILGVLACQGAHELSHVLVGLLRGVKMGPPFLIPNGQLGTFGAITQIKSRVQTRSQLWDVAAAGPLAGGALGLLIFLNGLILSTQGGSDLIPVPLNLLQGSFLLGGLTSALLGVDPTTATQTGATAVLVHPFLIAGWCALTTTALNLLPVGALDGGRMSQAAFGKPVQGFTGLLTYLGLALGVIGTTLSLPFGLYLLLTQRNSERAPCDDVSPVNSFRFGLTIAAITFSLLILLPLGVEVADPLTAMPPM